MDLSLPILCVLLLAVAGIVFVISHLLFKSKSIRLNERIGYLTDTNSTLKEEIAQERELVQLARSDKEHAVRELAASQSDLKNLKNKLLNQQEELEQKFELLANKILDEKSKKFTEQNQKGLEQILKPLDEKIKAFQGKVESTNKESIERHASLRQQILGLKELNEVMSKEAHDLTRALKGDKKLQGNWGELVLEKVLEKSGLEKSREYFVQQSHNTENGRIQPDVEIHMPDGKKLIVDSKVSLIAYEKFINAEDETEEKSSLKAHLLAIRNHINQLSEKNYHDIYGMDSPDFVLMFIPIETAFSIAVNNDTKLYTDAFDKNIVIVTPSTLLATLKTVDTMWQNEKQKKNTIEIARQAGSLYDKFEGLLNDLEKLGKQLNTASNTYTEGMKKLSTGQGNLVGKVEKLKKLGIKANKKIDDRWLDKASDTELPPAEQIDN